MFLLNRDKKVQECDATMLNKTPAVWLKKIPCLNNIYTMNLSSFKESLLADDVSPNFSVYIKALWYDAKDDWDNAHKLIQDLPDKNASWIHAFLHRKEGDLFNADYWYNKAGKKRPSVSLEEERGQIVSALL